MPSPANTTEPRADLMTTLEAFDTEADRQGFVGLEIAPIFEAPRVSGTYKTIAADQLLQSHDTDRTPGGGYGRSQFSPGEKSWSCKERGWEVPVDDNLKNQFRDYFDAETVAARIARDVLLRDCEQKVTAPLLALSNGTDVDTEWNDYSSDVIEDVRRAKFAVRGQCGLMPNTMVMDVLLYEYLLGHDQIVERASANGTSASAGRNSKIVNRAMLQELFNIERIVVADSQKNSVIPHQHASNAQLSLAPLWTPAKVLLAYVDRRSELTYPTLARTFHWDEDGSTPMGYQESYYSDEVRCTIVRCRNQLDINLVMGECGYLLGGCYAEPEA